MPSLIYLKVGAAALLLILVGGTGYRLGGSSARADAARDRAVQLQAVASAYQNQTIALEAAQAKLKTVQDAYDAIKDLPDPATVGAARRVLLVAARAGGCDLPTAASPTPGIAPPTALPGSAQRLERALDDYVQACSADARQLNALIQLVSQ